LIIRLDCLVIFFQVRHWKMALCLQMEGPCSWYISLVLQILGK